MPSIKNQPNQHTRDNLRIKRQLKKQPRQLKKQLCLSNQYLTRDPLVTEERRGESFIRVPTGFRPAKQNTPSIFGLPLYCTLENPKIAILDLGKTRYFIDTTQLEQLQDIDLYVGDNNGDTCYYSFKWF